MTEKYWAKKNGTFRLKLAQKAIICVAASFALGVMAYGHGSLEGSRILQVRLAGPSGGTPAAWNESYYTWNQNSNNFPDYASVGFKYSDHVSDGNIHNAGVNGVGSGLNFSGLNTPSADWDTTPIAAGDLLTLRFLATAPHDPSFFAVYLTKQGFDGTSQSLGWDNLEFLGNWSLDSATNTVTNGTALNPVTGGSMITYDWSIPIPEDRQGFHSVVVVWQRVDPAGEAFFATRDLQVEAIPEPGTVALAIVAGIGILASRRRKKS